jgi:hypothetical protein
MTNVSESDVVVIATGEQGPPGLRGNSILSGTAPPLATIGINGDFYLNTSTMVLYGPKAAGQWPSIGTAITGPAGPQGIQGISGTPGPPGIDGATILNGTVAPAATVGDDGDFYINTSTYIIYGPKTAGVWTGAGQGMVGPQPWTTPTTWAPSTAYVVGPPASCVNNAGSAYICLVSHTSGAVFNTDLTAGNWTLLASGTAGGGIADAPSDSTTYGRNNAAWVHVLPTAGGTMIGAITLAADPASGLQAATKNYVDAHSGAGGISDAPSDSTAYGRQNASWIHVLPLTGGTLTGPLIQAADPVAALGSATKQYVDSHVLGDAPADGSDYGRKNNAWDKVLSIAGGTLTGPLTLSADPVGALGAATKEYVDHIATVPIAFVISNMTAAPTINIQMAVGLSIAAGLGGSQAVAQTGPVAAVTFTLNKTTTAFGTPTALGTIMFAIGAHTATFAGAGGTLAVGDVLQLTTTATDTGFLNGSITVLTTRT